MESQERKGKGDTNVVYDVDGTASVVLHNFIASVISSTTNDPRLRSSFVVLDGNGVFADVLKPYVFECAVAIAVDAFGLVLADDGVFEGRAGFEEEDCVGFACDLY